MNCSRQPKDLKQEDISKAFEHAMLEFPNEACGVFTRSSGYLQCTNIDPDPKNLFFMKEFSQVFANKSDVIAVFHSHSTGLDCPSIDDMKGQIASGLPWCVAVLDASGEVVDFFSWGSDLIPPLLGRSYRSGVTDCFSIIRDAYKLWYNEDLPDFPRDKMFVERGENIYLDNYGRANFRLITQDQLMPGDVLLGSISGRGIINHGAVVLNNNEIIHHLSGHLSKRDSLCSWIRILSVCLRYEKFAANGPSCPSNLF